MPAKAKTPQKPHTMPHSVAELTELEGYGKTILSTVQRGLIAKAQTPVEALAIALSQLDEKLNDAIALTTTIKQLQSQVSSDALADLSGSSLAGNISLKAHDLRWLEGRDFLE